MKRTGLLCVHGAVLLFGVSGLFGKTLALSPAAIVCGRAGFAAVTLTVAVALGRRSPAGASPAATSPRERWAMIEFAARSFEERGAPGGNEIRDDLSAPVKFEGESGKAFRAREEEEPAEIRRQSIENNPIKNFAEARDAIRVFLAEKGKSDVQILGMKPSQS